MNEKAEKLQEGKVERAARIARNVNVLGALATGAMMMAFPEQKIWALLTGVNVAQVGVFELVRRAAKKKPKLQAA